MKKNQSIICIDCDGTLLKTDLLHEAIIIALKRNPTIFFKMISWLFKGKLYFKKKIAGLVIFNWEYMPFREEILEYISKERDRGSRIVLATASPHAWADSLAQHVELFDDVIASEETNLSGLAKADKLNGLYGKKNYTYVGDSKADLDVWKSSGSAVVVSSRKGLIRKAKKISETTDLIECGKSGPKEFIRALRVYQWMKNILLLVPLLASHQIWDLPLLLSSMLGFISFSLCASTGYIVNDLFDLESDRKHFRKRNRPFASCSLSILSGIVLIPLLLIISFGIAFYVNTLFAVVLLVYFVLTITYSFRLKKQVIVDVILLACLYTIRIIAGSVATGIVPSFWLLAFSMFIFLSLAMIKRYSEVSLVLKNNEKVASGRGYYTDDLPVLLSIGSGSGLCSVMILALYINEPETSLMYPATQFLWIIPGLLLYWISRIWLKAHRGEVHDDPVIFAAKDWQSRIILILSVFIIFAGIKL